MPDTTYSEGNGISITGDNNAIAVKPKDNGAISVTADGVGVNVGTGIKIDNNKLVADTTAIGLSYKANDETAKSTTLSNGLTFKQGDNVTISTENDGVVNISAKDTKLDSVTLDGTTLKVKDTSGVEKTQDLKSIDTNTTYTVTTTAQKTGEGESAKENGIIDIVVTPYDGGTAGTATTISSVATQKYVDDTEDYVTSGSLNTSDGTITLTKRLSGDVTITGLQDYVKGLDTYAVSGKYDSASKQLTITKNDESSFNIDLSSITSGLSSTDYSLTNGTESIKHSNKTGYNVGSDGTVSVTVKDRNGDDTETVNIGGIAVVYQDATKTGKETIEDNLVSTNSTKVWNEFTQADSTGTTSVALGKNTWVSMQDGNKAQGILFGNDTYTGGIAIGENVKSLNNSISVGINSYDGKIGNVDLADYKEKDALGVGSTSVGSNSYTSGSLSTNMGAYNIQTTDYLNGWDTTFFGHTIHNGVYQNFGSTIVGTMNSIESYGTKESFSGVANSIVGIANKTQNSNGSLIFGAGNEITNSLGNVTYPTSNASVADAAESYRKEVDLNKSGGAVLAIGGGNKADYVKHSQLMGVNNTVTGTSSNVSEFVMVDGYENTVTNSKNVSVIGSTNTVQGDDNKVYGDKHNVTGKDNVIVGSADSVTDTTVDGATILGHNANATVAGGVALGEGSIASRALGTFGTAEKAAFNDENLETATWKSTAAAVSVGGNGITRQITNVAAGSEDTDAVNVAQLRNVADKASDDAKAAKTVVAAGNNISSVDAVVDTEGDGHTTYTVNAKGTTVSTDGNFSMKTEETKDANGNVTNTEYQLKLANTVKIGESNPVTINGDKGTVNGLTNKTWDADNIVSGQAATEDQLKAVSDTANKGWNISANGEEAANVAPGATVDFSNTDGNIVIDRDGTNIKTKLNDDVKINKSLKVGDNNTFVADAEKGSVMVNGTMYVQGTTTITDGTAGISVNNGKVAIIDGTDRISMTGNGVDINGVTVDASTKQIHNLAAGTAQTDAVNVSQLEKAAAASKTEVTTAEGEKNLKVTSDTDAEDGHTIYTVSMSRDLDVDSVTAGDNVFNKTGLTIGKEGSTQIVINQNTISMGGQQIHNVAKGEADTDAVNVSQLKEEAAAANTDTHIDTSKEYSVGDDNTVNLDVVDKNGAATGDKVTINDVAKASDVGDISKFHDDVKNEDGSKTTVVDAINNIDTRVDKVEGDITTINTKIENVETIAKKHTTVSKDDDNITIEAGTNADGGKNYAIGLAKDITVDSVTAGDTVVNTDGVKVGDTASLTKDAVTIGNSSLTTDTLNVGGKTYIDGNGINANDQKITNVAPGEVSETSTDAINGSQLYVRDQAIINNSYNIQNLYGNVNKLDSRIKRVGAGAAALAALHPLDFDPDAKWDFAAGYGNYRGANAVAIGTFYRPNEDTMFNVGGSFGGGENMVNAGVSLKIGAGSSHVNTSKIAMAKEIKDMRAELESLKSALLDANAGRKIDTSKLQLFPDVPENHWAYEYVATLAGNGIIEGYPDGNFSGDRPMTRYEFAAMLYRAMLNGATLSDKVLAEFAPELERFTVDTIYKDKDGNPTVERVRVAKQQEEK